MPDGSCTCRQGDPAKAQQQKLPQPSQGFGSELWPVARRQRRCTNRLNTSKVLQRRRDSRSPSHSELHHTYDTLPSEVSLFMSRSGPGPQRVVRPTSGSVSHRHVGHTSRRGATTRTTRLTSRTLSDSSRSQARQRAPAAELSGSTSGAMGYGSGSRFSRWVGRSLRV